MRKATASVFVVFLVVMAASAAALAQWTNDPTVNTAIGLGDNDQVQPKVRTLAGGGCFVSWFDNSTGGYDVRLQSLDGGGAPLFGANGILIADRNLSWTTDYGFDIDADGNAYLAFNDDRSGLEQITATKVSPAGVQLWGATGKQLTDDATAKYSPKIVATTDGASVIAWTGETRKGGAVFLAKLDPTGAVIWDVTISPSRGYNLSFSDIVASDGGAVIVSWVRQDAYRYRHLVAQKYSAKGRPEWGHKGVILLDGASTLQMGEFPAHLSDGAGGAVFAWYTTGPLEAFVQRVNAGGAELFPHNGLAASTNAALVRVNPSLAFDPAAGDAYLVYYQYDPYTSIGGVYAQRVSAGGVRQWTDDGKELRGATDASIAWPTAVLTPTGLLAVWIEDLTYPDQWIYGAKVDASGAVVCPIFDVSLAPGSKNRISAEADSNGGGIFAWEDGRTDFNDVYGQRIRAGCGLGIAR